MATNTHPARRWQDEADDDDMDIGQLRPADDFTGEGGDRPRADPGLLVAQIMLGRLFEKLGAQGIIGKRGLAIGIRTPHDSWNKAIMHHWSDFAHPENPLRVLSHYEARRNPTQNAVIYYAMAGVDRISSRGSGMLPYLEESIIKMLEARQDLVFLLSDHESIPQTSLMSALDAVLEIEAPQVSDVIKIAHEIYGGYGDLTIDSEVAELVTPDILRLARRDGITASGYLEKVIKITRASYIDVPDRDRRKSSQKPLLQKKAGHEWTLDNLPGMREAKAWGGILAGDLKAYRAGEIGWDDVPRGALVSGPPGCGKTLFAGALARSCGVPLIATSYGEWQSAGKEGHLGEVMKAIRASFDDARKKAPCILFIDELDSVQSRNTGARGDDWWTSIINCLLAEMDGAAGREGVVVIGASNFPDRIDPAIRRAGRLDIQIKIENPDERAIAEMMHVYLDRRFTIEELEPAAMMMAGSSGADVALLCRSLKSAERRGNKIAIERILEVLRGDSVHSPEFLYRASVHEAGHAAIGNILTPGSIGCIDLRGKNPSTSLSANPPDSTLMDIENRIRVLLAGRASEITIIGDSSAGSGGGDDSDLAHVTVLAVNIEVSFGLGGSGMRYRGKVWTHNTNRFLDDVQVSRRVETRIQKLFGETLVLCERNREVILRIAEMAVKRRFLSARDIEKAMAADVKKAPCVARRAVKG